MAHCFDDKIFNVNDYVVYKDLEKNLLEQLELTFERDNCISDDLLESLYFIYKNPLLEALNQIDKQNELQSRSELTIDQHLAVCYISESKRLLYQVKGSIGINYYLFESLNFCSCSSFKYNVLSKSEYLSCKHLIIVKLLKSMNKITFKHVKDIDLTELIKTIQ